MLDHDQLDATMLSLGYQRLKKLVYRATWGNPDAAHYVIFELFGGKNFLAAYFAFRDETIDPIAFKLFKEFSGMPAVDEDYKKYFINALLFQWLVAVANSMGSNPP